MKKTITLLLAFISLQLSAQCWQSIATGTSHSIAIGNNGTLWTWGNNGWGQLGDDGDDRSAPAQIGTVTTWHKIAGGTDHSIARRTNGTIWAWGRND